MPGIETTISNISTTLMNLAPAISIILIVLGGIVYGLSYTQPPDSRGKWQTSGLGMVVGGMIISAIALGAAAIQAEAGGWLT